MSTRALTTLMVVLIAVAAVCLVAGFQHTSPEEIVVLPEVFDLGECEQGTVQDVSFTVQNNRPGAISLLRIQKTCSCIDAAIEKEVLQPGESGSVSAKWSLGNVRGKRFLPVPVVLRAHGKGDEEIMVLYAVAVVRGDIEFEPSTVTFRANASASERVRVQYRTGRFHVLGASSTHPCVEAAWNPHDRLVSLVFLPKAWPRIGEGVEVIVETNRPDEPTIRIPVLIQPES